MATLELLGIPQSNFVWTTRIAAGEKGVPHVSVPLPPGSEAMRAVHPLGKVPVARHGDVVIPESLAICLYLDRVFEGPPLVPADPVRAARVLAWWSIVATAVEPQVIRQYLFAYLFPGTVDGSPDRARVEAALPALQRNLDLVDGALDAGRFAGEESSLADAYLVPVLFYLRGLPESGALLQARPASLHYLDRWLGRESVRLSLPSHPEG